MRSLLLVLFLLLSCNTQEVCEESSDSQLVARFKIAGSTPVKDSLLSGITVFGLREGRPDSLIYDSMTISGAFLPLDPHNSRSRFIIRTSDQSDTILIEHNTEAYLISYSCGFAALFHITGASHAGQLIVDLEIVNSRVDAELEQNEEHLWIYF